jgi:hypothetical protein
MIIASLRHSTNPLRVGVMAAAAGVAEAGCSSLTPTLARLWSVMVQWAASLAQHLLHFLREQDALNLTPHGHYLEGMGMRGRFCIADDGCTPGNGGGAGALPTRSITPSSPSMSSERLRGRSWRGRGGCAVRDVVLQG